MLLLLRPIFAIEKRKRKLKYKYIIGYYYTIIMNHNQQQLQPTKSKTIFMMALLTDKVHLPITSIGKNIGSIIQQTLIQKYEGICIRDGYVIPDTLKVVSYSSPNISGLAEYNVAFSCQVCYPVSRMTIQCKVHKILKVGIYGKYYIEDDQSKYENILKIYITKDTNYDNEEFSKVKIDDIITVRIEDCSFELNDTFITVIASIDNKHRHRGGGDDGSDEDDDE